MYDSDDEASIIAGVSRFNDLVSGGNIYKIPFFQRSYVWEKGEWERFLDDMQIISEDPKDYFMGALILKNLGTSRRDVSFNEKVVVDGQQRLTTIFIFLRVFGWEKVKISLMSKKIGPILDHNHNDKEMFDKIMAEDDLSPSFMEANKDSKVLQCYEYFKDLFESEESEIKNINVDAILKNMTFICIYLSSKEDEQQIFDTMNSLGVSLTTGELLKNELYREYEEELYEKTWKPFFENSPAQRKFWDRKFGIGRNQRSHMDLLLHTYLLVKSDDYATGNRRMDMLFKHYKDALKGEFKENKETFINGLMEYAKVYEDNISEKYNEKGLGDNKLTQRLNIIAFGLGITPVIPYIVYILKNVKDEAEKIKIFNLLENFLMRRAIAKAETRGYNNYFIARIHQETNTYEKLRESIYKYESDSSYMPDDETLKQFMMEHKPSNMTAARIILYFLEHHARPEQSGTYLRSVSKYNVEHIMPKKWEDYWLNTLVEDSTEKREERKRAILTFGNLTLLVPSLNSSVRNLGWEDKKEGPIDSKKVRKDGLRICCRGLVTISDYLDKDTWNEKIIEERSEYLFGLVKELWPYDLPPKS